MREVSVRNRQRTKRLKPPFLRRIARALLDEVLAVESYELGVALVASSEMERINREFLKHSGSTDVITFDYASPEIPGPVSGEIILCVDAAVEQARAFRKWQEELVRYFVHGVLHLLGDDDRTPAGRRAMRRREDQILTALAERFDFDEVERAG